MCAVHLQARVTGGTVVAGTVHTNFWPGNTRKALTAANLGSGGGFGTVAVGAGGRVGVAMPMPAGQAATAAAGPTTITCTRSSLLINVTVSPRAICAPALTGVNGEGRFGPLGRAILMSVLQPAVTNRQNNAKGSKGDFIETY